MKKILIYALLSPFVIFGAMVLADLFMFGSSVGMAFLHTVFLSVVFFPVYISIPLLIFFVGKYYENRRELAEDVQSEQVSERQPVLTGWDVEIIWVLASILFLTPSIWFVEGFLIPLFMITPIEVFLIVRYVRKYRKTTITEHKSFRGPFWDMFYIAVSLIVLISLFVYLDGQEFFPFLYSAPCLGC